ncbi:hypothetical protein CK203_039647 [Vitis vinifera]|uniref:GAG-pre-integrase domain-containing protein n=1 Tax=Vitis vinifera TaxID=29760 RepID=A0A438HFQ7_VITVI|nr:hypothetical protein CK203_039647 [Vitis vinifera]
MVMAWLINSMEPEISQGYILYNTTKDIWDAANLMYSNLGNDSKLYELSEKARTIRQGDLLVMAYFNSLNILYQEIDLYQDIVWKNLEDHATYLKLIEKERVFKFLSGLRYEFDQERGRILSSSPIPSLREVFNLIRREESRIGFMMSGLKSTTAETSALSTANQPTAGNKNIGANSVYVAGKMRGRRMTKIVYGRGWNNGGGGRGWNPASGGGRGFQAVADFSKQPKQGDTGVPKPTKEQLEQFYKSNRSYDWEFKSVLFLTLLDQCTGKKIGSAKEVDRLFLLEEKMQGDEIKKVYQAESSIAENKEVWLWHCRLGHPVSLI